MRKGWVVLNEVKKKSVIRYCNEYAYKKLYFVEGKDIVAVDMERIEKKYNVDTVIKLFDVDFDLIKEDMKRLTHFNIQYCGHKPGYRYLILKIEEPGYFDGKNERPPILSNNSFLIANCLLVRDNLNYDELTESDFKNSLDNIRDVDSLKKAMIRRYEKSLAHLSNEEKLSLGISITELEIIERFLRNLINAL